MIHSQKIAPWNEIPFQLEMRKFWASWNESVRLKWFKTLKLEMTLGLLNLKCILWGLKLEMNLGKKCFFFISSLFKKWHFHFKWLDCTHNYFKWYSISSGLLLTRLLLAKGLYEKITHSKWRASYLKYWESTFSASKWVIWCWGSDGA